MECGDLKTSMVIRLSVQLIDFNILLVAFVTHLASLL